MNASDINIDHKHNIVQAVVAFFLKNVFNLHNFFMCFIFARTCLPQPQDEFLVNLIYQLKLIN